MGVNTNSLSLSVTQNDRTAEVSYLAILGLAQRGYCIAVDFDGTLCSNKYPAIGDPYPAVIERVKLLHNAGIQVILWTCREGERLKEALRWCDNQGLVFDAVNENTPELKAKWGNDPRKVGANEYWDDHAVYIGWRRQDAKEDSHEQG